MVTPMTAWALVDLINRLICYRLFKRANSKTHVGKPKFMVLIGYKPCLDTFGCLKANKDLKHVNPWRMWSHWKLVEEKNVLDVVLVDDSSTSGFRKCAKGHFTRHAWKWNKGEGKGMKTGYIMLCTILHMNIRKYVIMCGGVYLISICGLGGHVVFFVHSLPHSYQASSRK